MQTRTTTNPRRGDLYWLDWYPARGSEQAGRWPGLVVSNDVGNRAASTVIVAAVTTRVSPRPFRFQVRIPLSARSGLSRESTVMCEQLMTVSKDRLFRHIGALPPDLMRRVDDALRVALDLAY